MKSVVALITMASSPKAVLIFTFQSQTRLPRYCTGRYRVIRWMTHAPASS